MNAAAGRANDLSLLNEVIFSTLGTIDSRSTCRRGEGKLDVLISLAIYADVGVNGADRALREARVILMKAAKPGGPDPKDAGHKANTKLLDAYNITKETYAHALETAKGIDGD